MSFHYSSDTLHDIHSILMETLDDDFDVESAPRGKPIKELINGSFTLTNPRNRLINSEARGVNYGFAVGELCWYVRGDTDLATMLYYNKRMSQFSDDGKTIHSAYGARMLGPHIGTTSQFDWVVRELKADPDSRRAVMHINQPHDLYRAVSEGSKDVPCTLSIQLLVRKRRLFMNVAMRSNDAVWGLPYDVFSFTCLQEMFLGRLQAAGVPVDDLGEYNHTAGSLHLYETHYEMARRIRDEHLRAPSQMKPMSLGQFERIALVDEPDIRLNGCDQLPWYGDEPGAIDWMRDRLFEHRRKRVAESMERK